VSKEDAPVENLQKTVNTDNTASITLAGTLDPHPVEAGLCAGTVRVGETGRVRLAGVSIATATARRR
jgi:hypothetical protein